MNNPNSDDSEQDGVDYGLDYCKRSQIIIAQQRRKQELLRRIYIVQDRFTDIFMSELKIN